MKNTADAVYCSSMSKQFIAFIVMILSLPMILVTLGFFTIVVNGFLVWLSLMLAPGLQMTFLNSIFAGLILSLVNYVVSSVLELSYHDEREEKS